MSEETAFNGDHSLRSQPLFESQANLHPLIAFESLEPDFGLIEAEVAAGYISAQAHPHLPLKILNYTQQAQFAWRWNRETMVCRGLIIDPQERIVARPFPKFFSYEQLAGLVPNEPFQAYEKLDGSLGILYQYQDHVAIASRGSFTSPQALRATEIYRRRYQHIQLDQELTYLFEIIYPENRIVVDYGALEDLILIAVIETNTGIERPLPDIGFPVVRRYDGISQFRELLEMQDDSREGFVVRFESGQRVKIKFDEYKRLHKLLTGINPKQIWEALSCGKDVSSVIDAVPDEFFDWVKQVETELQGEFDKLNRQLREQFESTPKFETRRDLALYFQSLAHPAIMFAMLDDKPYQQMIWRLLRPKADQVFSSESSCE